MATRGAGSAGRCREEVALAPLCSLRPPPAGNGRWIQPAKGFSESAGTVARGRGSGAAEGARLHAERLSGHKWQQESRGCGPGRGGRGAYLREESPNSSRSSRDAKKPTCGADLEVVLAHPRVRRKVGVGGLRTV